MSMVSVCVVTYNHARYIRDCLTSVLAQRDDVPLEILVGDDLSEDETGEIVVELAAIHPNVIRYFRHPQRLGPVENYQFLIREARGEYIAHLDGDDFWLPGKLRRQLPLMESNPQQIAVYSNAVVVDDSGGLRGGFNGVVPESFDLGFLLRGGNFLCHGSLMYRAAARQCILEMQAPFIDYQIHIRLAALGDLAYVNHALVGYRVASATSMSILQSTRVRELYWQALTCVPPSPGLERDLASAMAHFTMISCWDALAAGRPKEALHVWRMVVAVQPVPFYEFASHFMRFVAVHFMFKFRNFVSRSVLGQHLKIYFRR